MNPNQQPGNAVGPASHLFLQGERLPELLFGTELELVLNYNARNWDEVTQRMSNGLTARNVDNRIYDERQPSKFKEWLIMEDGSIAQNRRENLWGLELVSPININLNPKWRDRNDKLWDTIESDFKVVSSDSCGTHVHVSTFDKNGWYDRLPPLKRVAKAVVYFERCVDSLLPPHRLVNTYCKSNRYNPSLRERSMPEIFQLLDSARDAPGIASIMCSDGQGGTTRYFKWNFMALVKPRKSMGTVEFRQPPGSTSRADAVLWSEFTLSFVQGAILLMDHPGSINPAETATLKQLQRLVRMGNSLAPAGSRGDLLEMHFANKQQLPEGNYENPQDEARQAPLPPSTSPMSDDRKASRFLEAFQGFSV